MANQNLAQLADYYDRHAWEVWSRQTQVWSHQQDVWSDDDEMLDMFEDDYNDHLIVSHFVRQGLLDKARYHLWRMDTSARDKCPDKVYNFLYPDI